MPATHLIAANEFCIYHNIEPSFIYSLQQSGLIEITVVEENPLLKKANCRNWKSWYACTVKWILTWRG